MIDDKIKELDVLIEWANANIDAHKKIVREYQVRIKKAKSLRRALQSKIALGNKCYNGNTEDPK
jgi:hypothetical protein